MPRKPADDAALIFDMLEYSGKVSAMTFSLDAEGYSAIEIIGEAARHVSAELKARHPEVPCRLIESQRHVLAHDYGEIVDEKIWRVATQHIPVLEPQLEKIMSEFPPPREQS